MAEILVKAVDASHSNPDEDRRGCYKRGMPVVVREDGHEWGSMEGLPSFVVIKIPGVPASSVAKYVMVQNSDIADLDGLFPMYRRRIWQIRWADLPLAARNKLLSTGTLTIKAGTYSGSYDYTWTQIKQYFRNLKTGLDESENM